MAGVLIPTHEKVMEAWLAARVAGVTAAMVAGALPAVDAWRGTGFLTVLSTGGTPDVDLPVPQPVVTVSAWYAPDREGGTKPPWGKAGSLAMNVLYATFATPTQNRLVMGDFRDVVILEATTIREPRKMPADPSGYARFDQDIMLRWALV